MSYWPWWLSGLALAGVMLLHWFSLHRMMAVSGRFTALVDRFRHGSVAPKNDLSQEEMLAAILSATEAEFGPDHTAESVRAESLAESSPTGPGLAFTGAASRPISRDFLFLGGLILGGAIAGFLSGGLSPSFTLRSENFSELTRGSTLLAFSVLGLGGIFVGFGTRMAGGCTSGHGLCGTSRLQPGSLLATVSFFAVGILVSFGLEVLL